MPGRLTDVGPAFEEKTEAEAVGQRISGRIGDGCQPLAHGGTRPAMAIGAREIAVRIEGKREKIKDVALDEISKRPIHAFPAFGE